MVLREYLIIFLFPHYDLPAYLTRMQIAEITIHTGQECAIHSSLKLFLILHPSHFFRPLFYFEISQNIVLFLKIKVINLLMFLLYPY